MADKTQAKLKFLTFWKNRIVFKFIMFSLPFLALISLALFFIAPYWYEKHSLQDFQDKALAISRIASYSLAPAVVFEDQEGVKEILDSLSQNQEVVYILVFDQNGKELARFSRKKNTLLSFSEIKKNGYTHNKQSWNVYSEIRHGEKVVGHLAIGFSMTQVYDQINYIRRLIAIASILMFGLGLILIYLLSSLTTRPLRQMTKTVEQIATGDLSQRATVSSADEVGTLARSFNMMVDKLKQTLDHLEEARENLEKRVNERTAELKKQMEEKEIITQKLKESEELFRNMVENLGEAVVIADADENFIFANQAANRIFEEYETGLQGKNLKEYLSSDQQQLVAKQTDRRKSGFRDVYELEITLKDGRKKTLLVNAVPQFDRAGNYVSTLAVMTDITGKKKEEAILAEAKASLEKTYAELKKNNEEASLLVEMGDALQLASSEEEIINIVINFARQLLPKDTVLFYLRPDKENFMQLCGSFNLKQPAEELINLTDCWAIRKSAPYFVLDPASELICPHLKTSRPPDKPVACLPLSSFGENLGLLVVFCCQDESEKLAGQEIENLMASKQRLLVTFSQRVAMALSNFRLRQSLQEQSIRDPLTGLYNRRYLEETLERELLRAKRAENPVSVIMLDIDHFKKFNDTYGHEAGDFILQAVARTIQKSVRAEDIVCRFGGEEFIVILPGLELEKAVCRAELILDAVRRLEIKYSDSVLKNLTISAGVAAFPEHGENWPELLQAADSALLQAKSQGRNRVVMAKKDNLGKAEE